MNIARAILLTLPLLAPAVTSGQSTPEVLDSEFQLVEFAATPDIVTPIGATFDRKGRLLVVESHTHKTPAEYDGPKSDRIRIIEDTDEDGRADKFRTFYEGTTHTMSLRQGDDGWLYVATRAKVFRIRDTDGDDQADEEQTLVHLETDGNYPHNGLSGLALDGKGHLYFGMGENLGKDYRMIGKDKRAQRGSGEGGVFRCDLDGNNLTRIATGFWNPFGICFDPHGRIFAVGNDADGRPPCRLVQIVETGDYGYQFKFGRSGRHPLQAWNGELPGTLPMAAATGEAPCEIAAYRGQLWVAIWGDYRIERYTPSIKGVAVTATRDVVVQGDHTFRPVALTESPDGSLYMTDWIDKSYPVHGKGRIWRLKPKAKSEKTFPALTEAEQQARLAVNGDESALLDSVMSDDVFQRQYAVAGLAGSRRLEQLVKKLPQDPRGRLALLQTLRWTTDHALADPVKPDVELLNAMLMDQDESVRLYATRWAADAKLTELTETFEKQLKTTETSQAFMATIAAIAWLKGEKLPATLASHLDDAIKGNDKPEQIRVVALRLLAREAGKPLPPEVEEIAMGKAGELLQREAIRTIAVSSPVANVRMLQKVYRASRGSTKDSFGDQAVADTYLAIAQELPAQALDVFIRTAKQDSVKELLLRIQQHKSNVLFDHPDPNNLDAWMKQAGKGGDANAGWRVFFSKAARCSQCHAYQGRGSRLGPDLTGIAKRTSRRDVLESILHPSRDIAPMFVTTIIETKDGLIMEGMQQDNKTYLKANGSTFEIGVDDIESRRMSEVSIMPSDLHKSLSMGEIRDLLALLSE